MIKIATLISYYNGHEFIEKQVDSILNQKGIDDFQNIIFIYDDGSTTKSLNFIKNIYLNESRVVIISDGENIGPFKRYISGWIKAINDGFTYIFFADQDDVFFENKYLKHITAHNTYKKSLVITSDSKWDYNNNIIKKRYKNGYGHNMSFNINLLEKKIPVNYGHVIATLVKIKSFSPINFIYHDVFLMFLFIQTDEIIGVWGESTALHRVHENSITNSDSIAGRPYMIWADAYNNYFYVVKPLMKKMFNVDLTINNFNKRYYFRDPAATEKQAIGPWIKWKLDNFAMYIRCRWLRNLVWMSVYRSRTTKEDWRKSKATHKELMKKTKAEYKLSKRT